MAATAPNFFKFYFQTVTADLATATTLGAATRLNFTSETITIPETGSRAFSSVILRMRFPDKFAAANAFTGVRMGCQLGAAASVDVDRAWTITASTNEGCEVSLDVTANFITNFGAATTQTCVVALALATTAADNVGGNILAWLEVSYKFDPAVGTTRLRWLPLVIGSHAATLTTAQTAVGSDGVNGPGSSQIPQLTGVGGIIEESTITFIQNTMFLESMENATVTTTLNPEIQIDSAAVVLRGTVGNALIGPKVYSDAYRIDPATFLPSATHDFKMRDTTTTGRYTFIGGEFNVLYTFDKSASTRQTVAALIFGVQPGGDFQLEYQGPPTASDANANIFEINIQDPGSITLKRAGVFVNSITIAAGGTLQLSAGSVAFRSYTIPAAAENYPIRHRCDVGSGAWTIARGLNRLLLRNQASAGANRATIGHTYAWVIYSSDIPSGGVELGSRPLLFHNTSFGATAAGVNDIAAASQIAPDFAMAKWSIQSMFSDCRLRGPASAATQLKYLLSGGEFDGVGFQTSNLNRKIGARFNVTPADFNLTPYVNRNWLASGKMVPNVARRMVFGSASVALLFSAATWVSVHGITFTVAGIAKVDGEFAPDGTAVNVLALGVDGVVYLVDQPVVAGGAGAFTCEVPSSTERYRCYATVSGRTGMSSAAFPPSATGYNIAIGASAIELTGQPAVSTSATTASFTFTATGPVEYSLDAGAYTTTTSPLNLAGLSAASHSITFRVKSDPTDQQTFTWTAGATGGGGGDATPPVETPISPTSNVQPGTGGGFSSDYQIAKGVPIVVQAVDASSAIAYVAIFIKYSNKKSTDVIYAGKGAQSGWMVPFKSFTSISGDGSATVGYTFTILPDTLWPALAPNDAPLAATITLQAVDASGNVLL